MREHLCGISAAKKGVVNNTPHLLAHGAQMLHAKTNMLHEPDDRWLSVEEIASYLGIKRDTVYKWIERRAMPAHKVGSLWKFRKDEIDDWVRSGNAGNEGPPKRAQ